MNRKLEIAKRFLKHNASTILSIIASGGVIVTSVMAVNAYDKAKKELSTDDSYDYDSLYKIKVVAKTSTPPILMGAVTIGCILGANALNKKQQASLVSAYGLVDRSYKKYQEKVKETYGEEAHYKILESIADEVAEEKNIYVEGMMSSSQLTYDDSTGKKKLFYDKWSNRFFISTLEHVIEAEYHLNHNYQFYGSIYIGEFYNLLGLKETPIDDCIGWHIDDDDEGICWINFNHRRCTTENGIEYLMIETPLKEPNADINDDRYCF